MYFNRGSLPWQGLRAANKQVKYEKISEKKIATSVEQLCKGYSAEFAQYLNYCRSLHFEDKPDYPYLRKLFKDLFIKEGFVADGMYDWCVKRLVKFNLLFLIHTAGNRTNFNNTYIHITHYRFRRKGTQLDHFLTLYKGQSNTSNKGTPGPSHKNPSDSDSEDQKGSNPPTSRPGTTKLVERKPTTAQSARTDRSNSTGDIVANKVTSFIKFTRGKSDKKEKEKEESDSQPKKG